jgi:Raf kinase inhibitor-like YbhB/YbcL family protein
MAMSFTLTSSAFRNGDDIPEAFTCDGDDLAPPLAWSGAPPATRSFALVMDDPDAPRGTFTHWVLYDIPATTTGLTTDAEGKTLPNGFGRSGYGGPCPPRGHGPHRYFFALHALDVPILAVEGKTREAFDRALRAHILATAQLIGRYQRQAG